MCWGFFWGLLVGGCLGIVAMCFLNAARDDKEYIELNHYEENSVKKENEVKE